MIVLQRITISFVLVLGLSSCTPRYYLVDAGASATLTVEDRTGGYAMLHIFKDNENCSDRQVVRAATPTLTTVEIPADQKVTIQVTTDIRTVGPDVTFHGNVPVANPSSVNACKTFITFIPKENERYRASAGKVATGCRASLLTDAGVAVQFYKRTPASESWSDGGPWCLPSTEKR